MIKKLIVLNGSIVALAVVIVTLLAFQVPRANAQAADSNCPNLIAGSLLETQNQVSGKCIPSGFFFAKVTTYQFVPQPSFHGTLSVYFWLEGQEIDHRTITIGGFTGRKGFAVQTNEHSIPPGKCANGEYALRPDSGKALIAHGPSFCNYCPKPLVLRQTPIVQNMPNGVSMDAKLLEYGIEKNGTCQPFGLFFAKVDAIKGNFWGKLTVLLWMDGKEIDHRDLTFGNGVNVPPQYDIITSAHSIPRGHCLDAEVAWVDSRGSNYKNIAVHTQEYCIS